MKIAPPLLNWYDGNGRKDLPWLAYTDPYPIWVSEIMLQQTQVATVIPYFQRFMQSFPTVQALADAEQDQVLNHWTGLGYYARGRNLHRAAQLIQTQYAGKIPNDLQQLVTLPGIGRSTAGAILAQAFGQRTAILDGNVKRVLSRLIGLQEWPGLPTVEKRLWDIAEQQTPETRLRDYTQAIMDLGATLCTRTKPNCEICPLAEGCVANQQSLQDQIPVKKPNKTKPTRHIHMWIIENSQGEFLLEKRPAKGIWGGLWSFPEQSEGEIWPELLPRDIHVEKILTLPTRKHSFSHYHLQYTPVRCRIVEKPQRIIEAPSHLWYNTASPESIGLAAPVKKLLEEITGKEP